MSDNKTVMTEVPVSDFIQSVEPDGKRSDSIILDDLMRRATGLEGNMWGENIVGYGQYHYVYKSGRKGDWFLTGFSPRKARISVYIMPGFKPFAAHLDRLGKHKVSKGSCLYINKLADVDLAALEELVRESVIWMREKYDVS